MLQTKYLIQRRLKNLRVKLNMQGLHLRMYPELLPSVTYYVNPTQEDLIKFHVNLLRQLTDGELGPDALLGNVLGLAGVVHNLIISPTKKKGWVLLKIVNANLECVFEMRLRHEEIMNISEAAVDFYSKSD